MRIIDGKKIAAEILAKLKSRPAPQKFLAVFLVGDSPASLSFIKQKEKVAKELGVDFRLYKFPPEIKNDELRGEIRKIVDHKTCGGAIVQLPLPEHINAQYVLNVIPREKDIDVLGERALGAFYAGRNPVLPPAVGAVKEIIANCKLQIGNCRVVVVGRGSLVGRPAAVWLMGRAKELVVLGRGGDLSLLKDADLVVLGAGIAGLVKPEMLKPGAGVIDFGYDGGRGDFDPSQTPDARHQAPGWYTPTPGGTGPILVAKLFENFFKLNAAE
jgi:methylenetetrahydrofolate dehydrogenase (NADP+)/methenyltetrahydrofolate cyclohydrolase